MNDSISTIFDRDLKWCPLFRNLKTLLLNEWFLENGLRGVLRILQHSPALEKITLKLYMVNFLKLLFFYYNAIMLYIVDFTEF